jgi:hypothetical protein
MLFKQIPMVHIENSARVCYYDGLNRLSCMAKLFFKRAEKLFFKRARGTSVNKYICKQSTKVLQSRVVSFFFYYMYTV